MLNLVVFVKFSKGSSIQLFLTDDKPLHEAPPPDLRHRHASSAALG